MFQIIEKRTFNCLGSICLSKDRRRKGGPGISSRPQTIQSDKLSALMMWLNDIDMSEESDKILDASLKAITHL